MNNADYCGYMRLSRYNLDADDVRTLASNIENSVRQVATVCSAHLPIARGLQLCIEKCTLVLICSRNPVLTPSLYTQRYWTPAYGTLSQMPWHMVQLSPIQ